MSEYWFNSYICRKRIYRQTQKNCRRNDRQRYSREIHTNRGTD